MNSFHHEDDKDEDGFLFINYDAAEVDEIQQTPQIPRSAWITLNWVSNSLYSLFDSTRSQVGHYLHVSGLVSTVKTYKDEHPFEKRKADADRIREMYPDRVPVICERRNRGHTPAMVKKMFGVPSNLTVGQFTYVLRKGAKIAPEQSLFIFVNDILPSYGASMGDIYEKHKDKDNFLYITYEAEYTRGFG